MESRPHWRSERRTSSDREFAGAGEKSVLGDTFEGFRRALSQGGSWITIVWTLACMMLLTLLGVAFGYGDFGASLNSGWLSTLPLHPVTPRLAALAVIGALVDILALPLVIGGTWGTLSQAIKGRPVAWFTFWVLGLRLYGRSWGFILYSILFGAALSLASAALVPLLHLVAYPLLFIGIVLTLPITIRMLGGLFVDELSFGESLRRSFHRHAFGAIIIVAILSVGAASLPLGLLEMASPRLGLAGQVLFAVVLAALIPMLAPAWILSLYRAVSHRE